MKKISIILSLFFCVNLMIAQNTEDENNESSKTNNISLGIDVFSDIWMNTPESLEPKLTNRGVSVFAMYEFPISKSNFSFAMGGGLTSHNLYSESYLHTDVDGNSVFTKFETFNNEEEEFTVNVDKNKLSLNYFDVPLEFRLKTKKGFMAAVGLKVGFLLQNHSKYKGTSIEELHQSNSGSTKNKVYAYENMAKNRYGVTARIGYKSINLVGFYSISTLFDENKGPEIYPISVGISIIPF